MRRRIYIYPQLAIRKPLNEQRVAGAIQRSSKQLHCQRGWDYSVTQDAGPIVQAAVFEI